MADTILNINVIETHDKTTFGVMDVSTYVVAEPVASASIIITPPGYDAVTLDFTTETYNVFTPVDLGTSTETDVALPDGIYTLSVSTTPEYVSAISKTFMRVEQLQEKFDEAFMKTDMMECDRAIKKQAKVDLNSIYFFIQASIAAANNCATDEAIKLYNKANSMLDAFNRSDCGCLGNNYLINFV